MSAKHLITPHDTSRYTAATAEDDRIARHLYEEELDFFRNRTATPAVAVDGLGKRTIAELAAGIARESER
jgi:hypothetical protein